MTSPAAGGGRHLLVTNDFPPKVGGIQSYLWELWRRLGAGRAVVLTASSDPEAPAFDRESARAGLRVERVPRKILYFPTPATRARVESLVAETGATLVLLDPVLPLGLLGPSLSVPYGVVLHGAEAAIPERLPGARRELSRVLAGAAVVVAAGRYPGAVAERCLRKVPPAVRPLQVEVPPGVDVDRFSPLAAEDRPDVRRRLGLPPDGLLVASVSRLVPRKGMAVLVEAARRLLPSFPDLCVAIAGEGRESRSLDAEIRRTGVPARLLGRISEEDKAALLAAADLFVMACRSRWGGLEQEGFGIVFLEAAAAGVAQVAGRSGGAPDAVDDGVTGVVVERPGDPGAVAAAMRRLLADEVARRRMGDAARRRARSEFSYDRLAAKLAAALAQVQG